MSELRCFLSDSLDLSPMITRWQYLQARDLGLIPGLGRSPGEEKGYPLQYSGLENSVDCIAHEVSNSWTWLSNFHFLSLFTPAAQRKGTGDWVNHPQPVILRNMPTQWNQHKNPYTTRLGELLGWWPHQSDTLGALMEGPWSLPLNSVPASLPFGYSWVYPL